MHAALVRSPVAHGRVTGYDASAALAVQGVALGWALLPLHVLIGLGPWTLVTLVLMIVVLVLTVASGVDYVAAQMRGARKDRRAS